MPDVKNALPETDPPGSPITDNGAKKDINQITAEANVFGLPLKGMESEIEQARLARKWYLKSKIRRWLAWESGDVQDSLADLTKALVLGQAIALGIVKDNDSISGYGDWVQKMLDGYGISGIQESMMSMLAGLDTLVFKKYAAAKEAIDAATKVEDISLVDVE